MLDIFLNSNIQFYIIAYFVGAIPFGYVLVKSFAKIDIKEHGSGSVGATNVLRVMKIHNEKIAKKLAAATLVLDLLKSFLLLLVGYFLGFSYSVLWGVGILAIIGHCFSPYLKFEGGKGVATALGVVLFFLPFESIIAFMIWLACVKFVKISSVSSIVALISIFVATYFLNDTFPHINTYAPLYFIAFIIIYKHIPNIIRIFKKEEQRVI